MKRKHSPPQFDLPAAGAVFNLAAETATDGARLQHELDRSRADRAGADEAQLGLGLDLAPNTPAIPLPF